MGGSEMHCNDKGVPKLTSYYSRPVVSTSNGVCFIIPIFTDIE